MFVYKTSLDWTQADQIGISDAIHGTESNIKSVKKTPACRWTTCCIFHVRIDEVLHRHHEQLFNFFVFVLRMSRLRVSQDSHPLQIAVGSGIPSCIPNPQAERSIHIHHSPSCFINKRQEPCTGAAVDRAHSNWQRFASIMLIVYSSF